jgi:CRP-like cAMP-binding protein
MTSRIDALAAVPMFAGLSKRHLGALSKSALDYRYAPGKVLIEQGDEGETLFVLLEGTAKVVTGGRTRKKLGPGDFVGEIAVLSPRPRTAQVVAETEVRCLVLHRDELRKLLRDEPSAAWAMLSELASRLAGD